MMIRAGFKDMDVMAVACMARNTVKTIRAKLVEAENNYEDVVNRKRRENGGLTCSRPLTSSRSFRGRS